MAVDSKDQAIRGAFARMHYINNLLNDSFVIYLEWFSSVFLATVAVMAYGCIRFTYLSLYSYLMYPACAVRCILESFSILALAGDVNLESGLALAKWRRAAAVPKVWTDKDRKRDRLHAACLKASRQITCSAGAMYTFEKSIVICNISHTVVLTMNLLMLTR